jgi:hypothetical protein
MQEEESAKPPFASEYFDGEQPERKESGKSEVLGMSNRI